MSELNGCAYCVAAHGAIGKMGGLSADELANYRRGIGKSAREDAILAFSRRIVRTGGAGAGTELAALREAGVSEGAISRSSRTWRSRRWSPDGRTPTMGG
ncbi:MAG TPA: carboxymuconolactone decarboxylase family protein [Myxococcota bacterium]|nr:carboxymuconolactone decarboxylase family protein [Myxococcota bacterium]